MKPLLNCTASMSQPIQCSWIFFGSSSSMQKFTGPTPKADCELADPSIVFLHFNAKAKACGATMCGMCFAKNRFCESPWSIRQKISWANPCYHEFVAITNKSNWDSNGMLLPQWVLPSNQWCWQPKQWNFAWQSSFSNRILEIHGFCKICLQNDMLAFIEESVKSHLNGSKSLPLCCTI